MKKNRPKKKSGFSKYGVVGIGIAVIALAVFYSYSSDQAKIRGYNFGNNLQAIQDELKQVQIEFESNFKMYEEGLLSKDEYHDFAQKHIEKMEEIVLKYDTLAQPDSFKESVKLFKLSTQSQLESDRYFVQWIKDGDDSDRIRSDSLFQESFEYEMAALSLYNSAKKQNNP